MKQMTCEENVRVLITNQNKWVKTKAVTHIAPTIPNITINYLYGGRCSYCEFSTLS